MSPEPRSQPSGVGLLGMRLLLASLSMLFASSIVGYLVVRSRAPAWPPPGMPRLPAGLWISTILILASSVSIQRALSGIRADNARRLRTGILVTALLGLAFLVSQSVNWFGLVAMRIAKTPNLYAFTFFLLTGLHAAHVIGGLVPLGIVTGNAYRGRYSTASHAGVQYVTMYWHFLTAVWLVMFTILYLAA